MRYLSSRGYSIAAVAVLCLAATPPASGEEILRRSTAEPVGSDVICIPTFADMRVPSTADRMASSRMQRVTPARPSTPREAPQYGDRAARAFP